jgi:hypothetical protein
MMNPPEPKRRFIAEPEDIKFLTPEEARAFVQKRRAEIEARREKMLRGSAERRAQEAAIANEQSENGDDAQSPDEE